MLRNASLTPAFIGQTLSARGQAIIASTIANTFRGNASAFRLEYLSSINSALAVQPPPARSPSPGPPPPQAAPPGAGGEHHSGGGRNDYTTLIVTLTVVLTVGAAAAIGLVVYRRGRDCSSHGFLPHTRLYVRARSACPSCILACRAADPTRAGWLTRRRGASRPAWGPTPRCLSPTSKGAPPTRALARLYTPRCGPGAPGRAWERTTSCYMCVCGGAQVDDSVGGAGRRGRRPQRQAAQRVHPQAVHPARGVRALLCALCCSATATATHSPIRAPRHHPVCPTLVPSWSTRLAGTSRSGRATASSLRSPTRSARFSSP